MDYNSLSDDDLIALSQKNYDALSDDGLLFLSQSKQPKRSTTLGEDFKIGGAGVANTLTKATGLAAGGIASAVGATDTADSIYKFMEDRVAQTNKELIPQDAEQTFGGKVASVLTTLPGQLMAMPFSPLIWFIRSSRTILFSV